MTFGIAAVINKGSLDTDGFSGTNEGSLACNAFRVTHPAVRADFTIGAESTNVRNITIQLKDAFGKNLAEKTIYELFVLAGASDVLATTGGSTGIADNGAGAILQTATAKLRFTMISDATGLNELTWTDTADESVRLAVRLPNGNFIITEAFANAA